MFASKLEAAYAGVAARNAYYPDYPPCQFESVQQWGPYGTYLAVGSCNPAAPTGTDPIVTLYAVCKDGSMPDDALTCPSMQAQKNLGSAQCGRGNPCDPATGNKFQAEEDYRSADGSLTYTRSYNSQINRGVGVGRNWTTNHHRRLEVGAAVLVRQADGRGEPFICTNSACQADPDAELTLLKDASGYELYLRNGTIEYYNLQGRLVSSQDRNGRTTQYSYDPQGRLIGITGPFGHHLTLIWNTDIGAVVGLVDPAGNTTTYTYIPAGPSYNLTQVTYPDGSYKVYHYENPSYPNHLTGISDENANRFATYAYDSEGRAISTEHVGGQERFAFEYEK